MTIRISLTTTLAALLAAAALTSIAGCPAQDSAVDSNVDTSGSQAQPGPAGPTGPQGLAGPQGPAGANGADGADGADGAQGATGATGATGAAGNQGAQGLQGAPGPQGPPGLPGTPGNTTIAANGFVPQFPVAGQPINSTMTAQFVQNGNNKFYLVTVDLTNLPAYINRPQSAAQVSIMVTPEIYDPFQTGLPLLNLPYYQVMTNNFTPNKFDVKVVMVNPSGLLVSNAFSLAVLVP